MLWQVQDFNVVGYYYAQLGVSDKGRKIKGLVVFTLGCIPIDSSTSFASLGSEIYQNKT